jgi:histidine ammonia-lyase
MAMDYMAGADGTGQHERAAHVARLVDADSNGGVLPMFLTAQGGLESGLMMAQYTAAALASENKVLAHPASADSIPSSANVEDHVSMGATAVRQLAQILDHVETIVAIELLSAAQGVPFVQNDIILYPYMEQVRQLVADGTIKRATEAAVTASK